MSATLAKEILGELRVRRTLGDRIMARVGKWGWERPRVAVSGRIFRLYRIADPWDPNSKDAEDGIGVVSPRFAEDRRKPAPHALPKEDKPKSPVAAAKAAPARPADSKPPTAPRPPENKPAAAPEARPTPTPKPGEPAPTTAKPPAPKTSDPIVDAKSGLSYIPKVYDKPKDKAKERPLLAPSRQRVEVKTAPSVVGRLPVRAGVAVPEAVKAQEEAFIAASAAAAARAVAAVPVSAEARRQLMTRAAPASVKGGPQKRAGRVSMGPALVVTNEELSMELEVEDLAPSARTAMAPLVASAPAPNPESQATEPAAAPRPAQPASFFDDEPATPAPPRPKVQPRPPKPGKGDDLDDMFASSLNEGRMRLGKPRSQT